MTQKAMPSAESATLDLIREALRSSRWADENQPGAANLKPLHQRISDREQYLAFKNSEAGAYLVEVAEALDEGLNDEWLPERLFGLQLPQARQFLSHLASALESGEFSTSLPSLRESYTKLYTE